MSLRENIFLLTLRYGKKNKKFNGKYHWHIINIKKHKINNLRIRKLILINNLMRRDRKWKANMYDPKLKFPAKIKISILTLTNYKKYEAHAVLQIDYLHIGLLYK